MKFVDLICKIVEGFEIKKGSIVLLNFWGENSDLEILDKFTLEIAKAGGIPIKWQQSRKLSKAYFAEVSEENLNFPNKYFEMFKLVDSVIDILMYSPAPHRDFPKNKLPLYRAYMRKLFAALTQGKQTYIQVRVPTEENALEEDMDYEVYKESMYNAINIDYPRLKEECTNLVNKLKDKNKVTIYTGDYRALTFNLGNRSWFKDDGLGDIPCGEVYIAPIEDSVEGEILIPQIFLEGQRLLNVLLEFNSGKLVNCSSMELLDFIKKFPGNNDLFAEFGIGLNENVKKLVGCMVIDEKCMGTAHIAIGMNNMFGGKNSSRLHMDFIFTPVKIEVDGKLLMDGLKIVI